MQHETLQVLRDSSIVETVENISFQGYGEMFRLEARAILVNGWKLDVFLHRTEERERYSFHLSEDDSLIVRWDNAPHHPGIRTHPYHRHESGEIYPSEEMDVRKVLGEVRERMGEELREERKEAEEHINDFEEEYGMGFQEFEEYVEEGEVGKEEIEDYNEWSFWIRVRERNPELIEKAKSVGG